MGLIFPIDSVRCEYETDTDFSFISDFLLSKDSKILIAFNQASKFTWKSSMKEIIYCEYKTM